MQGGFARRDGLTAWLPKAGIFPQPKHRPERGWVRLRTHTDSFRRQSAIGHQTLRDGRQQDKMMGSGGHRPGAQGTLGSCKHRDPEHVSQEKAGAPPPPKNLGGGASVWARKGCKRLGWEMQEERQGDPGSRKKVCKEMGVASSL